MTSSQIDWLHVFIYQGDTEVSVSLQAVGMPAHNNFCKQRLKHGTQRFAKNYKTNELQKM
jgi:hypothetical protein